MILDEEVNSIGCTLYGSEQSFEQRFLTALRTLEQARQTYYKWPKVSFEIKDNLSAYGKMLVMTKLEDTEGK